MSIIIKIMFLFLLYSGAHMRRASADLEKRRASVGAAGRSFRGDGTLDPHHAAILFRDSRGVSEGCFNIM